MKTKRVTSFAMMLGLAIMLFGCTKTDQQATPSAASTVAAKSMSPLINVFMTTESGEHALEALPLYKDGSVLTINESYKTDGTEDIILGALDYAAGLSQHKYSFVIKLKTQSALYFYPADELQNDADISQLNDWVIGIFQGWLDDNSGMLEKEQIDPSKSLYLSLSGML